MLNILNIFVSTKYENMKRVLLLMLLFTSLFTLVGCDATSMSQFSSALSEQNGTCSTYTATLQSWSDGQWKEGLWYDSDTSEYDIQKLQSWADYNLDRYKYYKVGLYDMECPYNSRSYRISVTCY